jgi:hypothetical protein
MYIPTGAHGTPVAIFYIREFEELATPEREDSGRPRVRKGGVGTGVNAEERLPSSSSLLLISSPVN